MTPPAVATRYPGSTAASLEESEERYRALQRRLEIVLEAAGDPITVQDRSGRVVYANAAAAALWGFATAGELSKASGAELATRFDIRDDQGRLLGERDLPACRALAGEPQATALVHAVERRTGRAWWSLVRASAVPGSDDQPELAVNVWHDVTAERRQRMESALLDEATAALAKSLDHEETLAAVARILVQRMADWAAIRVLEGGVLKEGAVAHTDAAKLEAGREYGRRFPPDPGASALWEVVRTGKPLVVNDVTDEMLVRAARSPDHLRTLRAAGIRAVLVAPIRARGEVTGTIALVSAESGRRYDERDAALVVELGSRAGIALDNARLFTAERKARERLELLARAGEELAGGLDWAEALGKIVRVALPALADVAVLDVAEGTRVQRVCAAHDDPGIERRLETTSWGRRGAERGSAFHPHVDDAAKRRLATTPEELDLLRKLELRSMITVPLRARAQVLGSLTLCFGKSGRHHTLDDLRLAEELARRAAAALVQARLFDAAQAAARRAEDAARAAEEANRLKDEFLATVSHELRTPLNAILGWATLLRAKEGDAWLAKGVDVIRRNAEAQARIVEDILDVSRIITGKLRLDVEPTDLVAIVKEAIEVVRPSAAAKGISVDFASANGSAVLLGDPDRLRQVVWNLLSNAVKFTQSGGRIAISLEQDGSTLSLAVRDTGRGIDPEFLPYVFDRFKQGDSSTTRRFGGLGLGLAIVRHIVELHGGSVAVESAGLDQGAVFRVSLPVRAVRTAGLDEAPEPTSHVSPASGLPASLAGLRVVVVDDDDDARELVQRVLAGAGAAVETAGSAALGFQALRRFAPHVLVSDIGMPEEDGYSLVRRVRALGRDEGGDVPAIALTAYARSEDRAKALAAGFTMHLGKPVEPEDLIAAVASVAARPG